MGDAGGSDTQYTFPYATKNLLWDANHFFNAQNKYSYTGKGRKLGDPMLQCDMCEQWFHLKEVSVVSMDDFVAFQRNYRFSCKVCTQGPEQFELQSNTWTSIILTAIYNLLLTDDKASLSAGTWLKVSDIIAWLQEHWGSLASGRDMEQLTENSAVQKCILYPQNATLFSVSEDKSEVLLKHVAPSKLLLKPLVSSAVPGIVPVSKPKKSEPAGGSKRGRKRGSTSKDAGVKEGVKQPMEKAPRPEAPSIEQIKLPDKYKLLAVPKNEGAILQDTSIVQLSRIARAPQIALKEDRNGHALTAVGYKGFRMVRATHGVANGCYYYEVTVKEPNNGEDGHTRIGWSTEAGDVQAPVGYDVNSYSYRDVNGGAFHESMGKDYGEPYGPGDVIGCLIKMGDPPAAHRERQRVTLKGVEYIVEEEMKRTVSVGSSITFYKNGKTQSTAFTDVWAEVYYPAVSLYKASVVEFNFGPSFAFPPPSDLGSDVVKPVSDLATPPPKPEGVEAGAGESSKAGEGENAGEEAEEAEGEGDEMDDAM